MAIERRRGARIRAEVWVAFPGVHEESRLHHGDISSSGIYFECAFELGDLGRVQLLRIASADRSESVELMARLVRVVACEDLFEGRSVAGAAFEFLFFEDRQRAELARLLSTIAALGMNNPEGLCLDYQFEAQAARGPEEAQTATVSRFALDRLTMETDWSAQVGETISLQMNAPGWSDPVTVEGHVITATSIGEREGKEHYRVEVGVTASVDGAAAAGTSAEEAPGEVTNTPTSPMAEVVPPAMEPRAGWGAVGRRSILDAVDALLAQAASTGTGDAAGTKRGPFSGELSQVPVLRILRLIAHERLSGDLRLQRPSESATFLFSEGQLVDAGAVDPDAPPSPTTTAAQRLKDALTWRQGTFAFDAREVASEGQSAISLAALLRDD